MRRLLPLLSLLVAAAFAQEPTKPRVVRVFLLAGQSNMEGHGVADLDDERDYNGGRGTLLHWLEHGGKEEGFADLRNADGTWATRDDVFVSYRTERGLVKNGPLSVGFGVHEGKHHIGPELGIGRALGDHFEEPVLLVKTAWGGKSLAKDFRPPSADGDTGPFYVQMLDEYRAALQTMAQDHPTLAGCTPQLTGFVWFQGWNDACDRDGTQSYAQNLALLMQDVRKDLGDVELPFVVGETGNWDREEFREAQRRGCHDAAIARGTRFVATRHFLRKKENSPNTGHGHHWFGNGESYFKVGCALGKGMCSLLAARTRPAVPAGENPLAWLEAIAAFDAEPLPPRRPVVFVGSSSIRGWKTLAEDMAPMPVLNRGFGGSKITDAIHWLDELVARHDPSAVVVFTGTNDLAGETPRSAEWVAERFDELVARLRALGCEAPVVWIAITPTPSRVQHLQLVQRANELVAARCAKDPTLCFVVPPTHAIGADGKPDAKWFQKDLLHLNADGYREWTQAVRPVVEELVAATK